MKEGSKAGSAMTGSGGRNAATLPHFDHAIRPKCPPLADPDRAGGGGARVSRRRSRFQ